MSFDNYNAVVKEGDTAILYFGKQNLNPLEIDSKQTFQSKFGAFHHRDLIGKKYGTKVHSSKKGWGYLLRPTPELWTVTLPHRTQILYTMDISMITFELELKPGSIVVESGTGSGSLSHAIIRTVKPNGHLYTFDFHQTRVLKAQEEFAQHYGAGKYVTSACADACVDGFNLTDQADAVFLDLPTPWDAIPHARTALKKTGGRLCSFSPCIEQVQRTCVALKKAGFCEVKTVECLVRSLNVLTIPLPDMNFDCDFSEIEEDELEAKKPKIDSDVTEGDAQCNDIKSETQCSDITSNVCESSDNVNGDVDKKVNGDAAGAKDPPAPEGVNVTSSAPEGTNVTSLSAVGMVTKTIAHNKKGKVNMLTCRPEQEVTGHTGYLTFASLLPRFVSNEG